MALLQNLYEKGKITYHRTDSTKLSPDCERACKNKIVEDYGDEYYKYRSFVQKIKMLRKLMKQLDLQI